MTPTLTEVSPTTSSHPPYPEPRMRDRVLSVIGSRLGADPRALADQLRAYYELQSDECGTSFLDGSESEAPYTITAADLFALAMLGVQVSPPAARRLLRDTVDRVASCTRRPA